ncbi:DNA (cytosine-5-)-methyltransferase [Agarivorans sp. B2Z047]|uniref:DNA cytosine methyltransferase n=1 Tax=Agarivorans sp. B2Z047 TaxID=2652721 RepID=UPI00128D7518|nr:DNA cytosine methyltransferase [Agarivorans sp. B2Z047]MPW31247.1 DNA (cytosine-5-)-methyltransferase [Agarivorans sp. B2Z047]UQN42787.1 DNA cytosine methyltransferase [Agarivorans sp. B2Z047]
MARQLTSLNFNSFFAGIGGFDLAFENQGFKPSFQCEINTFCQSVLQERWPDVPLHGDISSLSSSDIPEATIWCGGFPCQDLSVARGSKGRDGLRGSNSGLFYPFFDLIASHKPEALIIENVAGLLSSHNGQDFRIILEKLTSIGYAVAWRVVNSRFFGAPQSRPRVFICAFRGNPIKAFSTLFEEEIGQKPKGLRQAFLDVSECQKSGAKVAQIAYCLAATSGRHTGTDWSRTYVSYPDAVRRLTPSECEGIQGFPKDWTSINSKSGSDSDTDRYHALGNAVSVPVVEWIAKRLKQEIMDSKKPVSSESLIENLLKSHGQVVQKFREQDYLNLVLDPNGDEQKLKWMSGGIAFEGKCLDFKATEFPRDIIPSKLIDVIEKSNVDQKYFISANAAEGILRRVKSQNRSLFGPLNEALVTMAKGREAA